MVSTPKMEYQIFLFFFKKNSAIATLGLKEMGKPKVAIAKFIGKMQKKSGTYYENWVVRHASFPPRRYLCL